MGPRWRAFSILFVIYVFNFVDRSLLGILAESIKAELAFSDTQLGVLTGIAFAIFYTTMGLPIARLAAAMPAQMQRMRRPVVVRASHW